MRTTMLPTQLQRLLGAREVRGVDDRPRADHQVRLAGEDRRGELRDVVGAVLVVGVGIDDDVGAGAQRRLDAGGERPREALVAPQADDVIDAGGLGDGDRLVGAAVVDDHPLDPREARHRARQAASVMPSVVASLKQGIWMIRVLRRPWPAQERAPPDLRGERRAGGSTSQDPRVQDAGPLLGVQGERRAARPAASPSTRRSYRWPLPPSARREDARARPRSGRAGSSRRRCALEIGPRRRVVACRSARDRSRRSRAAADGSGSRARCARCGRGAPGRSRRRPAWSGARARRPLEGGGDPIDRAGLAGGLDRRPAAGAAAEQERPEQRPRRSEAPGKAAPRAALTGAQPRGAAASPARRCRAARGAPGRSSPSGPGRR